MRSGFKTSRFFYSLTLENSFTTLFQLNLSRQSSFNLFLNSCLQIARITVNLNECQEDLENAIKRADFQQAALLKDQIADLQSQKNSLLDEMGNSAEVNGTQRVERVSKFSSIPVLPMQTFPPDKSCFRQNYY